MNNRPYRDIVAKKTRQIMVGSVPVGGDAPISVQTMTNTLTTDEKSTIAQIQECAAAGPPPLQDREPPSLPKGGKRDSATEYHAVARHRVKPYWWCQFLRIQWYQWSHRGGGASSSRGAQEDCRPR